MSTAELSLPNAARSLGRHERGPSPLPVGERSRGEAEAGEGDQDVPERAVPPHPALRADLSPLRRGEERARWRAPLIGLALPLGAAAAWELAVRAGLSDGRLMAPPSRIAATLVELWRTGDLALHIGATASRVAAGFGLGVAAGTALGGLAGASTAVRRVVDPTLQGLRAVPSIAWVPLFILWLGIFETSKVALIAAGVFFPVYLGVLGAIASIDRKTIEVGRIFRLSRFGLVRRILLPAILPAYVLALRAGLGLGWMFVVAAEFMGASEGLGYLLVDGQQLGKPDQIVAAIVVFALIGKATDSLLVAATTPLLRWQDTAETRA